MLINILSYEDIKKLSTVRGGFRDLCLPHLFTEVHLEIEDRFDSGGSENLLRDNNNPPWFKRLYSASDISIFYNDYQNGFFENILSLIKLFSFHGLIPSEAGIYYRNGVKVYIDECDIIAGYGPADTYTLYYWFVKEIVGRRLDNLRNADIFLYANLHNPFEILLETMVDCPATTKLISLMNIRKTNGWRAIGLLSAISNVPELEIDSTGLVYFPIFQCQKTARFL